MRDFLLMYIGAGLGGYIALWFVNFGTLQLRQINSSFLGMLLYVIAWPYMCFLTRRVRNHQIGQAYEASLREAKAAE